MFYQLEPEVAGGWGCNTKADTSSYPPSVNNLHYEFEGWLGDSVLDSFPCYIITEDLASSIKSAGLTGFDISECEISKSETFIELYPKKTLPAFSWLKVSGKAGSDDFGINIKNSLVVSAKALSVLQSHSLDQCDIEPYNV